MYPLPLQSGSTSHPKKVSSTLSPPQIPASQTPSKPTPPPKNINLRQIYIFFQSHKTLLNRPLLWFPQLHLHTLHIHFSINHPKKNSNRHPKPKPKSKPKKWWSQFSWLFSYLVLGRAWFSSYTSVSYGTPPVSQATATIQGHRKSRSRKLGYRNQS